jgi:hypothetical protein
MTDHKPSSSKSEVLPIGSHPASDIPTHDHPPPLPPMDQVHSTKGSQATTDRETNRENLQHPNPNETRSEKDRVPAWAKGSALEQALRSQPLDADKIFGRTKSIDLNKVFGTTHHSTSTITTTNAASSSSLSHSLKSKYWQELIHITSPKTPDRSSHR